MEFAGCSSAENPTAMTASVIKTTTATATSLTLLIPARLMFRGSRSSIIPILYRRLKHCQLIRTAVVAIALRFLAGLPSFTPAHRATPARTQSFPCRREPRVSWRNSIPRQQGCVDSRLRVATVTYRAIALPWAPTNDAMCVRTSAEPGSARRARIFSGLYGFGKQ